MAHEMTAARKGGRLHYAWLVVGVTFLVLIAAAGVRSVPGILILPLEEEFGWNRATVSLAVSINLLLYGLIGPFAAAVMERIGVRRMMVGSLLILTIAVALTTQMRAAWQLQLLWGVLVGIGSGAMAGWISATIANRWFSEHRGLVVGVLTAAGATGQLLFLPLLARMVETIGWRPVVLLVSAATLFVIPPVIAVIRNYPQDVGALPVGAKPGEGDAGATAPGPVTENPFVAAPRVLWRGLGNADFRLLAGSFFICGATTNGLIGTHLIPASHEHGISEVTAASFLAVIGIFDIIGTTCSGWLSDRYDNRWLLCWYYSLRGLSLLFLPFAFDSGLLGLGAFVVFYGLDWVATVPPTVRLAADLFGRQRVGTVFAWILAAHQLGAATAAFGAGALRDRLGDYQASFLAAGLLCLIAAALVTRISRTASDTGTPAPDREVELALEAPPAAAS